MYEHHIQLLEMIKKSFESVGIETQLYQEFNALIDKFRSGNITNSDRYLTMQIYRDGIKHISKISAPSKELVLLDLGMSAAELEMQLEDYE